MKYGLLSFLLMIVAVIALTFFSYSWDGWDGVGAFGSVASILGLTLTFKIAWDVTQIRKRYVTRIMVSKLFDNFEDALSKFNNALSEKKKQELRNLAGRIRTIVDKITLHLYEGNDVEFPDQEIVDLVQCTDERKVLPKSRDLAPLLSAVQTSLELVILENEWRRDDG